jgi:uncharacterized membrane protein YbhN (UPF0104 family)
MSRARKSDGAPPRFGRRRDWSLGAILLAAVVVGVALTVGWGPVLAPWRKLPPGKLLLPFGLAALSYFFRGARIHDYFRPRFEGRFLTVLRLSVLHNTANNLLPMRAGEMVFPWLMGRYFGHGFVDAAASLAWLRFMDLHFLGLVAIFILYLREPSWTWSLVALLWLLLPLVAGLTGRLAPTGRGRLGKVLHLMVCSAPGTVERALQVYLWTALTWISKFLSFALVLGHFLPVEPWQVLVGVMGAELSTVLPFHGIAGSGSYEAAVVAALLPLGIDANTALAGAVNLHLFLLGVTLILGLLALLLPVRRRGAAQGTHKPPS